MTDMTASRRRTPEDLVAILSADLVPVKRLWRPSRQALLWLLIVVVLGAVIASLTDLPALARRLAATPDLGLAIIGSTLTSVAAAFAAFMSATPGRPSRSALLVAPPLALWLGASGFGYLRGWVAPGTTAIPMTEMRQCLVFILLISVPLSALTLMLLRRSWPVRPGLTAALAGLAVAAAAASLLALFHPYDASATDLAIHLTAVAIVVAVNRLVAGAFLSPPSLAR